MPTIAYIFSGSELSQTNFDLVYRTIFSQVLASTPTTTFDLRGGGVLLWTFSYRTSAVERGIVGKHPSISHTMTDDKALRSTLAVAVAKSASTKYHRLDTDAFARTLLNMAVECVTASELSLQCSDLIDEDLRKNCLAYKGCFEVDKGDPLTLRLAANGLIPFCTYANRMLKWLIPFDETASQHAPISWSDGLGFERVQFSTETPDYIALAPFSEVGEANARLLNSRAQPKHAERVLSALRDSLGDDNGGPALQVSFGPSEFGSARADVRKLRDYCLNDQHEKGKHKAHVFRKLLGIKAADWLFLAEQLLAALSKELVQRPANNQWGVQYHVVVPVLGRNGETKLVKCSAPR